MQTMMEYELKAQNCSAAARVSLNIDDRMEYIRMSAVWRNEALRVDLGDRVILLRLCPFTEEQLLIA